MEVVKARNQEVNSNLFNDEEKDQVLPGYNLTNLTFNPESSWPAYPANNESLQTLLVKVAKDGLFRQGLELLNILNKYPVEELVISLEAGDILNGRDDMLKYPDHRYIPTSLKFRAHGPKEDPLRNVQITLLRSKEAGRIPFYAEFEIERA